MNKVIYIILLLASSIILAQNSSDTIIDQYNEIINYIPKNLQTDTIHKVESNRLEQKLNSIINIKLYYVFKKKTSATDDEIQWLDKRIEKLATGLFIDGKRILFGKTGGSLGCPPKKLIDTIQLNAITITNLKFCYTCTESNDDDDFIKIFNTKMYHLMQITPPDGKTFWFYGTYTGKDKQSSRIKLILINERKFKFWINKKHNSSDFTEGFWENRNDTLILNSRDLNKIDSISFLLSSANWIEFDNVKFRLKRNKLIDLESKKWKLKKVE